MIRNLKINEYSKLRKLLFWDFTLGGLTGILLLIGLDLLVPFLQLPTNNLVCIGVVSIVYALFLASLYLFKIQIPKLILILVIANWLWVLISLIMLIYFLNSANIFGHLFFGLQIMVITSLAYLEGKQLKFN